jgi:hypothetical protein
MYFIVAPFSAQRLMQMMRAVTGYAGRIIKLPPPGTQQVPLWITPAAVVGFSGSVRHLHEE